VSAVESVKELYARAEALLQKARKAEDAEAALEAAKREAAAAAISPEEKAKRARFEELRKALSLENQCAYVEKEVRAMADAAVKLRASYDSLVRKINHDFYGSEAELERLADELGISGREGSGSRNLPGVRLKARRAISEHLRSHGYPDGNRDCAELIVD
jgi:hypothetical protein